MMATTCKGCGKLHTDTVRGSDKRRHPVAVTACACGRVIHHLKVGADPRDSERRSA